MINVGNKTYEVEVANWKLVSKYLQECALAEFLGVEMIDVAVAIAAPDVSEHRELHHAILHKYSDNELIYRWVKHMPPDQIGEILEWIEDDLLTRN